AAAAHCRVAASRAGVLVVHRRIYVAAAVLPFLVFVLRLPRVLRRPAQPEELGPFGIVPGVRGGPAVGTAPRVAVTTHRPHQRPCLVAAALHETVRQAKQGTAATWLVGPLSAASVVLFRLTEAPYRIAIVLLRLVQSQPVEGGRLVEGDLPRVGGAVLGAVVE